MTLLELVQTACRELVINRPSGVSSSTDDGIIQLHAMLDALGQELVTNYNHDWQDLIKTATITTDGGTTYSLPSDYSHQINRTQWDESNRRILGGPVLPQGWQWLQSSSISDASPFYRYRIQGGVVNIYPTPSSGLTLKYQYVSKNWVVDGDDSSGKSSFTKDTDTAVFRDRLMITGLKLKWYEQKGFDTTTMQKDFLMNLDNAMAQDAGAPTLSLSGNDPTASLLGYWNLPDSGYG